MTHNVRKSVSGYPEHLNWWTCRLACSVKCFPESGFSFLLCMPVCMNCEAPESVSRSLSILESKLSIIRALRPGRYVTACRHHSGDVSSSLRNGAGSRTELRRNALLHNEYCRRNKLRGDRSTQPSNCMLTSSK